MLYLPNGVDTSHFTTRNSECPPDYAHLSKPIALYVGTIASWFHQDWLIEAARAHPDISFVLIGPQTTDTSRMRSLPNIHLLGSRDYATLPPYLEHADVGLIPFAPSPLVEAVNPVKLYEYMAAGLPVVATDWEELRRLDSPAILASTAAAFTQGIRDAVTERNQAQLVAYAEQHTWRARFQSLMTQLA